MTAIAQTWFLTVRLFRQLLRQPWWIAISLAQPIIWLVLYGQLFKRVVDIPGFGQQSYITFLAPGVVIMSALYGAGWSGMGVIDELDRGVIDRFLVAPTSRAAIIGGRLLSGAISTTVQCMLLLALGLVMGARYPGGLAGVCVMAVSAVLLGLPIGALVDRAGIDDPAQGIRDRRVEFSTAADDVPVAGLHGELTHAGLDPQRVAIQSRDVERRSGAVRAAQS